MHREAAVEADDDEAAADTHVEVPVRADVREAGVITSNDATLTAEDMALGYKRLLRVAVVLANAQERTADEARLPLSTVAEPR